MSRSGPRLHLANWGWICVTTGLRRWGVFNLVGLAGFVVQISAIAWLTRVWGWPVAAATAVAMEAVIVQNYFAHSRWTWADRPARTRRDRITRSLRYQGAKTVSLTLNVTLTAALVAWARLSPEVANVLAVGTCALFNYAAADRLVFTPDADIQEATPETSRLAGAS